MTKPHCGYKAFLEENVIRKVHTGRVPKNQLKQPYCSFSTFPTIEYTIQRNTADSVCDGSSFRHGIFALTAEDKRHRLSGEVLIKQLTTFMLRTVQNFGYRQEECAYCHDPP